MTQLGLFTVLHVVGMLVGLATGAHRRPALCCALGFPVGLAIVVLLATLVLLIGLPYRPATLVAVSLVVAIAVGAIVKRGIDRRTGRLALLWTAGFAAACAPTALVNLSVTTYDSHWFVMLGSVVGREGRLPAWMLESFSDWGSFQVIAQSLASFTRSDFLYGLAPALGLSFAVAFGMLLWHAGAALGVAPRPRLLAAILVPIALFSNYNLLLHAFYIHTNLAAGMYLFGYVALSWLAEVERDPALLPLAFLLLLAAALQRVEATAVALIFLALTAPRSQLPRRPLTVLLGIFTVTLIAWFEILARHVPESTEFMTPTRCHIAAAALVGFFAWWLASAHPRARAVNRFLPVIVAAVFALTLAAAFIARSDHMVLSFRGWLRNLAELPTWGHTWYVVLALALLGLASKAPPNRAAFVIGIPVYLSFILLLSVARKPYYFYEGDSGNRMTLQTLPLIFFYFGLKLLVARRATT